MQDSSIPTVTRARSRLGNATKYRPDEVDDARRDLAAANLAATIKRIVSKAPPLTDDQRSRLALLLRPDGQSS